MITPSTTGEIEMNLVGFNPNYPTLHMCEALKSIMAGDTNFNHDDIESILKQGMLLIEERSGSFTRHELSELIKLLESVRKMWLVNRP
jgi:hypothetical protein